MKRLLVSILFFLMSLTFTWFAVRADDLSGHADLARGGIVNCMEAYHAE